MATDAVLWGLLAAAIALITWGCHVTRQTPKAAEQAFEPSKLDRAA